MSDAAVSVGGKRDVVGREAELARVDAFLQAVPEGPAALVIRGEPGIGKTALWRYAVDRCRASGFEVLVTRAAAEEMSLALAGLVDLFEPVSLVSESLMEGDALARGRAVLAALRHVAASRPTVVAIDDVQWLDAASARALRFALRRLDSEAVGILATARAGSEPADPLDVRTMLAGGRCEELDLGPLSLEALRQIVSATVASVSRPMLRRIHEASGGNPLYAIELARALAAEGGAHRARGDVRLPGSLQAAIDRRLETVPSKLVELLETVAALGPTSVQELRTTGPHADMDGLLDLGERDGLLVVESDLSVRFTHPLLASAVYARMSPLARRRLHQRLAAAACNPDVRARHLALSSDEPDEEVAVLLEQAAARASGRGAYDRAAEFAGHSLRLTPQEDREAAARRAVAEIDYLAAAGEVGRALALSDVLISTLPPGSARSEALLHRYQLDDDESPASEALLLRALADASGDDLLRSRVLRNLAGLRGWELGDMEGAVVAAREALALADMVADPETEMVAAAGLAHLEAVAGRPRPDLLERAVALEEDLGSPSILIGPSALGAKQLFWAGELAAARGQFEKLLAHAVRSGNEFRRPYCLYDLALVDCAAGALTKARNQVGDAIEAARDAEDAYTQGWLLYPLALVEAWLGRAADARAAAGRLLARAERLSQRPGIVRARSVLGLVALSEGDAEQASRELGHAAQLLEEMGYAHPGTFPVLPNAIEAAALAGQLAPAAALLERLEHQARAVESAWALAAAERCTGLLLVARGEPDAALAPLEHATASFETLGHRPDAARAALGRGRALLRLGQRSLAAEALEDARARFAAMGAALWEARAREELERASPGRSGGDLTPAERRIASLVAEGRKNREIGLTLFMSVATVEAHLTRIYRKLGIRSRAELARLVAERRLPAGPPEP